MNEQSTISTRPRLNFANLIRSFELRPTKNGMIWDLVPGKILKMGWQASKSIKRQREFQEMIAALHCSYPLLLPQRYKDIPGETLMRKVEALKQLLNQ